MLETNQIELRKALANSFLFTFNAGRNQVRNFLIEQSLNFVSNRIDYNGNSSDFATSLFTELMKQNKLNLLQNILVLTIANEDNSTIKDALISFL